MHKKKVGLLTMPIKSNYGGIIQIIALYHFLEKEKFQPVWIDKKQWYNPIKQKLIKLLENNPLYKIYDPKEFARSEQFFKILSPFLKKYLPEKTPPIFNQEQLVNYTSDLGAVVVGSDQVWRLEYVKDNYPAYFLDFVPKGKKKIAYAASFGKDYWEGGIESIEIVKQLLSDFDLITVREDTGMNVCKETFNVDNPHHVLDPTFLPDVQFYKNMIDGQSFKEKTGLFNYVLDSNQKKDKWVQKIARHQNLGVSKIYLKDANFSKNESLISRWLAHFYYADFVVTDSFHGMVFSIIFNKQFLVIGNKERGLTRFTSLLKLLDLENRLIEKSSDIEYYINTKIDYTEVNQKLETLREKSKKLLVHSLS